MAGTFAYSPAAGTVLPTGTHTLSATFTPADTTLYNTATASTSLVVRAPRTTPTVSWATPAAITQGTALSATQLNASASVAGTFAYSPAAGTVLPTGTHTLTATFTPADTTLYNTATASTVAGRPGAPHDAGCLLGHACGDHAGHGAQRDAAERQRERGWHVRLQPRGWHGARDGNPYADGHLHPGRHDALQHRHRLDRAGGERTGARAKTTPTLSWAAPAAITQGTALSATQLNASASVAGSFAYSPAAGTVLAAGNHTLTATFTPADTTLITPPPPRRCWW